MAQAAQIRTVSAPETGPRMSALQRLLAPVLVEAEPAIVSLVLEAGEGIPAEDGSAETDWPAAIQMIRDVASRVRQARAEADEVGRRAEALAERSARQAAEAETRLRLAEAETQGALLRAEQAEAAARAAEARAAQAEEAMRAAQADRQEAQVWLKRLYASVLTEFEGLTEVPAARAA
ncbi:hypothetical protein [Methylobacterium dankookense]|uniref:Uncharacterized protein n=1 Tax=Methylobacterium dankookense TaxID=560405 RepID=A0A564FUV5_9HYPH|nr:hypothetical protein [Methylobacterium dankookense]GJD57496.1 hypothetical protein IFDJLNFL_3399 [Methylobacterium dankookense]VUF11644.1 hypothetical protein MTDSW087_01328 [Methylobacterium dankookense]